VWFVFSLFIPASPLTGAEGIVDILTISYVTARKISY
jgi:hypothetical protein